MAPARADLEPEARAMARSRRDTDSNQGDAVRGALDAPPVALLDDPLRFLDAHHARQRAVCGALRRLAAELSIERGLANDVAVAMAEDLTLHHRDEDEDLFPLLLQRALPEDGLVSILAQLSADHIASAAPATMLREALVDIASSTDRKIDSRTAALAAAFATRELRHLAIEVAIVMVIARKRLKPADLLAMSRSMKSRRGIAA